MFKLLLPLLLVGCTTPTRSKPQILQIRYGAASVFACAKHSKYQPGDCAKLDYVRFRIISIDGDTYRAEVYDVATEPFEQVFNIQAFDEYTEKVPCDQEK